MEGKQREGEGRVALVLEARGVEDRKTPPPSLLSVTLNSGFRFFHSKREDLSKREEDFTIERWTDGQTNVEIASADHKSTSSDESVPPPSPACHLANACLLSCSCSCSCSRSDSAVSVK